MMFTMNSHFKYEMNDDFFVFKYTNLFENKRKGNSPAREEFSIVLN